MYWISHGVFFLPITCATQAPTSTLASLATIMSMGLQRNEETTGLPARFLFTVFVPLFAVGS